MPLSGSTRSANGGSGNSMQPIEFIYLGILFAGAGLLSVVYYRSVPPTPELRRRLPNRTSVVSVAFALAIGALVWYISAKSSGLHRVGNFFSLIFGLLFLESLFILLMRWCKTNWSAMYCSAGVTGLVFLIFSKSPTFFIQNLIIIVAVLGAATLLIRLGLLKSWYLVALATLWVPYDIYLTQRVLPAVTVVTSAPYPTLLYPAVTVGTLSLGAGDFMFLVLFTLVLLRDFGTLPSIIHVAIQAVALLGVGLLVQSGSFIIPMMVILAPIYLIIYGLFLFRQRRGAVTPVPK